MTLARSLLHALKDHGATRIFGIPGDFALPLFKVIEDTGILPLHTLSHEPGSASPPTLRRGSVVASGSPRSPMAPARSTWSTPSPAPAPSARRWW